MRNIFKRIDNFYDNNKWFRIVFNIFEYVAMFVVSLLALLGLMILIKKPVIYSNDYDLSNNDIKIDYALGAVTYVSYDTQLIDDETFISIRDEYYIVDWMDYKTSWVGNNKMVLSLPNNVYIKIGNGIYSNVKLIEVASNSLYLIGNGVLIKEFNYIDILSTDTFSFAYMSYNDGYNDGYDDGYDEGFANGIYEGYSYGFAEGLDEGFYNYFDNDNAFMYKNDENFPHLPNDDYDYSALLFNTKKGQELGLPYAPLSSIMETEAYFIKSGDNYLPILYMMKRSPLNKYQYSIFGDSSSNVEMNNDTLFITLHYHHHQDYNEINFYNYEGDLYNTLTLGMIYYHTGNSSTFTIQVTQSLDTALGDYWLNGYDEGLATGEGKGFNKGYQKGLELGRKQGYDKGLNDNPNNHWSDLLFTIFGAFGTILAIEILPGWSIGIIIGIPIVFGIIYFIIGRKKD